jgi:DNA-binding YbaB/EbfC family protein
MSNMDMGDILRQAGRMKKDMEKTQEDLKSRYVQAAAGDGRVEVTVNGQQELVKVSIEPEFLKEVAASGDADLLEDLVVAAVSQGVEKSKALMKEEMDKISGGLGGMLPGLL